MTLYMDSFGIMIRNDLGNCFYQSVSALLKLIIKPILSHVTHLLTEVCCSPHNRTEKHSDLLCSIAVCDIVCIRWYVESLSNHLWMIKKIAVLFGNTLDLKINK